MTPAELRRAMWISPLALGTAVLAGAARIAVAAIDEELPLGLGVALILLIAIVPVALTIRARRRYRARLLELGDPITGSLPEEGSLPPVPLRLRLYLIGAPLLAAVALVLAANEPGDGNTCVAKGIATAAAREGICKRGMNLFGGGVTYNVVNAGDTLSMPDYQARLIGSSLGRIPVDGPNATPALYPNGQGTLVSFQVAITNTGDQPLTLATAQMIAVFIPDAAGSEEGSRWRPFTPSVPTSVSQAAVNPVIEVGQSNTQSVSFILPPSVAAFLHARPSDLDFYPVGNSADYIGQIRLWKAAGAAGRAALALRSLPNVQG